MIHGLFLVVMGIEDLSEIGPRDCQKHPRKCWVLTIVLIVVFQGPKKFSVG